LFSWKFIESNALLNAVLFWILFFCEFIHKKEKRQEERIQI